MEVKQKEIQIVSDLNDSLMISLKNSLYPGAKEESIKLVISYCKAAGLDPMQKPVHIVPMSVKEGDRYIYRDVIMPGVGLYRIQAARTGEYGGITEPEFGDEITRKLGGVDISFPEWCKITVKRIVQGKTCEFTVKEFWIENYATAGKNTDGPNAMWKKRPHGQLAKCAEAQALRKAYPEVGSHPTNDEMEGKTFDINEKNSQIQEVQEIPLSESHLKELRLLIEEADVTEEIVAFKMSERCGINGKLSQNLDCFPDSAFDILKEVLEKKIQQNQEKSLQDHQKEINMEILNGG